MLATAIASTPPQETRRGSLSKFYMYIKGCVFFLSVFHSKQRVRRRYSCGGPSLPASVLLQVQIDRHSMVLLAGQPVDTREYLDKHGLPELVARALTALVDVVDGGLVADQIGALRFIGQFLRNHHPRHPGALGLFDRLDVNGSGAIELDEMISAVVVHGGCTMEQFDSIWSALDCNADAKVVPAEFSRFAFEFGDVFHRMARVSVQKICSPAALVACLPHTRTPCESLAPQRHCPKRVSLGLAATAGAPT